MRIVKTIGVKVISKLRFDNTFDYFDIMERDLGDWPVVGELVFVWSRFNFLEITYSSRRCSRPLGHVRSI